MKNYFQILQLSEDASFEDIKQAYRRLAKLYHPDVNKSPEAHAQFCEITEAYDFLLHHWPNQSGRYSHTSSSEQKYREYQETDAYRQFRNEAQERARRQAKMRYEKFKKQHEAFQESGIYDLALAFTIIIRLFSVALFLFLFLAPVIFTAAVHWTWIFGILFMWPFAFGIAWYYYDNRDNYFCPGKFYYSADRIKHLFTDRSPTAKVCYYSPGIIADSKPYKLDLLKQKEIKYKAGGFRNNTVNYKNDSYSIMIPRSRKALIVHSTSTLIKIFSLIYCIFFLYISSIAWKFILGLLSGGIFSAILFLITQTRSNVSYLFSYGFIIRFALWITAISITSRFYFQPFDIYSTDYIHFTIVAIIIFDSLLMQILDLILGKYSYYPLKCQYPEVMEKFKEGFKVYNDIPVISVIYPLIKWMFG